MTVYAVVPTKIKSYPYFLDNPLPDFYQGRRILETIFYNDL
jgi:hypothetical protein